MYRLKYNKVIFLVNISLHEYSSSFVFTQYLKNTLSHSFLLFYVKIQSPILIVCIWVGVVCGYTVYRGRVDVCTSGGTVGVQ